MATDDRARAEGRISTGVPGLDDVLRGGLLRGGFYMLQGDPGSGKTTVALQFIHACKTAGERCLYVSLTESRADLERTCRAHGLSLDGVALCDWTHSSADLEAQAHASVFDPADMELSDVTRIVRDEILRLDPQVLVLDGLSEMRLLAGDALRYRRTLLSLKELLAGSGVTTLLLDDRSAAFKDIQPESLVGGNIVLERYLPAYGRTRRRLHVSKVRGAHFREGYHDYEILTGGVVVQPRLVANEHHAEFATHPCPSGIDNLDTMLAGGLHTGTTTLLLGPAGVGKSTVSMQFVVNAIRAGKKAAVYVFDEVLQTLRERSEKLCIGKEGGFGAFVAEGKLHVQQVDSAELSPGAFAHEVRRAVEAGAEVVVIDSLNGYLSAMPDERFLTTHLHEMFAYLNQKGVLTVVVVAQHGMMVGGSGASTDVDVSYLADSVLLFRYFENNGEVDQAISVFKKRTGPHERTIRRLSIDEEGVHVGEPLRGYRGIMTGIPQYQGSDLATTAGPLDLRRPLRPDQ